MALIKNATYDEVVACIHALADDPIIRKDIAVHSVDRIYDELNNAIDAKHDDLYDITLGMVKSLLGDLSLSRSEFGRIVEDLKCEIETLQGDK